MTDFLLEIRSEEIPARMQEKARADLAALFEARMRALNLGFAGIETYATPRRLALIVRDVAATTTAMVEERKGPRADAPAAAIEGFLRSTGLSRDRLVERDDGKGGRLLFAVVERAGVPAQSVLASAAMHAIHSFPWPKSMRWGEASLSTESLRWVRPLQGIVAMLGEAVIDLEVAGVRAGAATVGHRFHHPGVITFGGASDYAEKLRACHVIVDGAERRAIIAEGARRLAAEAGLELIEDEGLLYENAGLTEWPVPLLGRFDEGFLDVPPEVIQLTARVNQKYFVCRNEAGKLANAFVCVANIEAKDGGEKIVEGNRKVLAARLSDARFFYETDLKVPLEEQAEKLAKIVFHEKLGTVADKVERVAKLARWLVEEGIVKSPLPLAGGVGGGPVDDGSSPADTPSPNPSRKREGDLAALAERAARLAKADLVTGMVGEFPELQGVMGGYYALAQGEDPAVAEAIRDHYKPVGQGDDVPTAPLTVAVSLADKLDTLLGFFFYQLPPTGSKDPFALRRASLAVIQLLIANGCRVCLMSLADFGVELLLQTWRNNVGGTAGLAQARRHDAQLGEHDVQAFDLLDFFADRLKVQQREAGVRHDLIDAVFALGGEDDLVRLLARVKALQSFIATEDGANLVAGYKRAANILRKEGWETPLPLAGGVGGGAVEDRASFADMPSDPFPAGRGAKIPLSYTPEPAEDALIHALAVAEPMAAASVEAEDFAGAMAALAALRAPIDAFFDTVTVNDSDADKRAARLALLARMRDAVHKVADFSKIEG